MNVEGTTGHGVFASSSLGLPRRPSYEEEEEGPTFITSSASIGIRSSLRQSLKRAATAKTVVNDEYIVESVCSSLVKDEYSVESVCSSLSKGGSRRSTRPKRASSFQTPRKDACHLPVKRSEHVTWQLRSSTSNRRLAGTSAPAPARKYSSLTVTSDDDYTDDVDDDEEVEEYEDYGDHDSGKRRRKLANKSKSFPAKLYQMLQEVEENGLGDVVSWLSHGRAIRVHDPKRFVDEVMTHYFRQSKITSFQRQLNVYGFRRLVYGIDAGAYHHPLFLRGVPELLCKISRVGKKGTGCRSTYLFEEEEPNFHAMPPIDPSSVVRELIDQTPKTGDEEQNQTAIASNDKPLIERLVDMQLDVDPESSSMTPHNSDCEQDAVISNLGNLVPSPSTVGTSFVEGCTFCSVPGVKKHRMPHTPMTCGCLISHAEGDRINFEGMSFSYIDSILFRDDDDARPNEAPKTYNATSA